MLKLAYWFKFSWSSVVNLWKLLPFLGQFDGEVDNGTLPARADLRVDGAALEEDCGLAAAALFPERGL